MIKASCLCNKIEFEAEEVPGMTFNCHCSRCKKSHGAAFSTQFIADIKSLKILKGEQYLSEYHSPKAIRTFCSHCGARLMNYDPKKASYLSVSVSALDHPQGFRPTGECFAPEKLEFITLDPSIPHYQELPKIEAAP